MKKATSYTIFSLLFTSIILFSSSAMALPFVSSYLNPSWTDADKLHTNNAWGTNYWNDLNNDGRWSPAEPLADAMDASWAHGKSAIDNTCWIASASNMLASAGYGSGDAQAIYWDIVNNMTTSWHTGLFGWQDGGWQHEALNWYLANRPDPTRNSTITYYGNYSKRDGTAAQAWPVNPFDMAANALAGGDNVGIVINGFCYHAVTFQGYDTQSNSILITDSDRDAAANGLDSYLYDFLGTTDWRLTDYPLIPIDYFAILDTTVAPVPEPSTFILLGAGLGGFALYRRRMKK